MNNLPSTPEAACAGGPVEDQGDLAAAMLEDIKSMTRDEAQDALAYLVGCAPKQVLNAIDFTIRGRIRAGRRAGGEGR